MNKEKKYEWFVFAVCIVWTAETLAAGIAAYILSGNHLPDWMLTVVMVNIIGWVVLSHPKWYLK